MTTVHLVGSVALDTVQDVFQTVGTLLRPHIKRCPDGEVGGRRLWISWQWPLLRSSHFLELCDDPPVPGLGLGPMRIKTGATEMRFGELGYAREARSSYIDFCVARQSGLFEETARLQVSLPTPAAVIGVFITPTDVPDVLKAYEDAMSLEVARLCEFIPHNDLALQWDVCFEMLQWDNRLPHMPAPKDMENLFAERFSRLCALVPKDVQLGFHLCYGDMDGKHGIEPLDLANAVGLSNLLVACAKRPIDWVHMPVPIERDDDAYFSPLRNLNFSPATELMLGLVHAHDGADGALRRMKAAQRHVDREFGISTECGMGRARTADTVGRLLRIHATAAKSFAS